MHRPTSILGVFAWPTWLAHPTRSTHPPVPVRQLAFAIPHYSVLRPRPTVAHSRTQLASTSWPRLAWLDAACCRCPPQARPPFACLRLQHTPAAAVPYGEQETQSREARKLIRRPSSIRDTASGGKLVSACGQRMHEHMTARNSRCSNQNRWSLVRFDWNPAKSNSYWAGKRPPLLQILGLWLLYIAGADGCSLNFFVGSVLPCNYFLEF
jgi:hypothetical protein